MKISVLIPCHNEEKSIEACVLSCLNQTRKPDQIVVVNDGSTDKSREILMKYYDQITLVNLPKQTGNKSFAQQFGLKFITGDIFITTDGDTLLDKDFVKFVEENFNENKEISALGGYVRSQKHNWITACRAFEYTIGQNLHKLAQHHMGFLFVIPGAAGAFKTNDFKNNIYFEHDTLTEDLDFTYRLHSLDMKIMYDMRLIAYTQDPVTLSSYMNQMRRWFGGGWQCLLKHHKLATKQPKIALELSFMYFEGFVFSTLLFILPLISLKFFSYFVLSYFIMIILFAVFSTIRERRLEFILITIPYSFLVIVNSYVFLEQFIKEVLLKKRNLSWYQPERFNLGVVNK